MKIYFILLCALLFSSCYNSNNKEIPQDIVSHYLKDIHKKENYKPILFGKLDSVFAVVDDTKLYEEYHRKRDAFEAMGILSKQFPDLYSEDELKANKEQEEYFHAKCDSLESVFTYEFTGWKIQHIYEYKNSKGENVVDNHIFFLDKEIHMVIKDEQIYTNLLYKTYIQDTLFYGIKR